MLRAEGIREKGKGLTEENNALARLALAEAIIRAAREMTNPRGGAHGAENLRTECDAQLREMYETTGADRVSVRVNGQRVGTLSARVSKPRRVTSLAVTDFDMLRAWLRSEDGGEYLDRIVAKAVPELAEICLADGVVPDGCAVTEHEEPAHWLGTTLRVDKQKVAQALGPQLPQAVAGFLEG